MPARRSGFRRWSIFRPTMPPETLFRSSVALENLVRIEAMLRGSDPFGQKPKGFGGLTSPKWPSQIFPDDPAWKINPARVDKGRAIYAEICVECHLGPVNDPAFDSAIPGQELLVLEAMGRDPKGAGAEPVEKSVGRHGNGPRAGQCSGDATGRGARLPRAAARAGSRECVEMHGSADLSPRPTCRSRSP